MKRENEVEPVILLTVCLNGAKLNYLQQIHQHLVLYKKHCLPLSDTVFLLDEIETTPALFSIVAFCNRENIPLCAVKLSDAPPLISPDAQDAISWLRERGYSGPKLTKFPPATPPDARKV